jgi:hypothetical protein
MAQAAGDGRPFQRDWAAMARITRPRVGEAAADRRERPTNSSQWAASELAIIDLGGRCVGAEAGCRGPAAAAQDCSETVIDR